MGVRTGWSVDSSKFSARARDIPYELQPVIGRALKAVGYELLRKSGEIVPLDEATLQNSGVVEQPSYDQVDVRYSTPYATRQHEDLTMKHTNGRQAKYLESPLKENLRLWLNTINNILSSFF